MDPVIVREKLESLRRCIARVESRRPAQVSALEHDPDLQDIIVLNLTRAIQICVDIGTHILSSAEAAAPRTMGDVFTRLEELKLVAPPTASALRGAVGFRNLAVHNYDAINWAIVHALSHRHLEDFRRFAAEISVLVEASGAG